MIVHQIEKNARNATRTSNSKTHRWSLNAWRKANKPDCCCMLIFAQEVASSSQVISGGNQPYRETAHRKPRQPQHCVLDISCKKDNWGKNLPGYLI